MSNEEEDRKPGGLGKDVIEGIERFDPGNLKHAETQERNRLPDIQVLKQEKAHKDLIDSVECFDKSNMKHATTVEKIVLPNAEDIEQEKSK